MARHTDAVCKLCRREGQKLFLKGERCLSPKCAIDKRNYPPGAHGRKAVFRRKQSDFGLQLREKQKARRVYGVMEKQFRRYFKEATRRKGLTGTQLLVILESRLDNVVYRLGFADSRAQARQLVRHGHFEVNGRKTDIPSFQVSPGDTIQIREKSRQLESIHESLKRMGEGRQAQWLSVDKVNLSGTFLEYPRREDIPTPVEEQLIVELYSK